MKSSIENRKKIIFFTKNRTSVLFLHDILPIFEQNVKLLLILRKIIDNVFFRQYNENENNMTEEEMERGIRKINVGMSEIPADVDNLFAPAGQFKEFMMMYSCAIKEVRTKFEILNDDLSVTYNRNPIEMIKSRIKTPNSIVGKMRRKGIDMNMSSLMYYIEDVAGIRVICSFIDDIYEVAQMLISQDDITLVSVKDYIKHPKPNGYRSYHMIVEVPVFFANHRQNMKVEVQLRTIAMDFWASLEHKMKYKKEIEGSERVVSELKKCADNIAALDAKMQEINYTISDLGDTV